ncbi:MAG: single-stranded-DNA-specific exonuclease RecJ [Gammaproteobacteria bacterium]
MDTVIVRREPRGNANLPVSPLLQRISAHRGVRSPRELELTLDALAAPASLKGMGAAVELLCAALDARRRILIVADYDADGATSCALALRALRAFGAADVQYLVPNRFEYGYGLTPEIVAVAAARAPDLLITVDNGISSLAGVAAAKARGIQVLITDHHLPGAELPAADAIVNPNQPGDEFPSKNLAGVGVIFYVMLALRARLRERGWFAARGGAIPNLGQYLDLVALGTVADVVTLDHTNRILVEQGLRRIRAGHGSAGINALCTVAGRDPVRLRAADLGFALGPRLNAAGRLADMSLGIQCLLCDDAGKARLLAARLDRLNRERRDIEAEMQAQAFADLDLHLSRRELPFGLCLYDESWHQGVIGILAARVKDKTHRPVIAFAANRGGLLKGSARSVPGLHIRDALDAVAARHPGLVSKFGGHAAAAGMSLEASRFEAFQNAFDAEVRRHLSAEDLRGIVWSDGELDPADVRVETAEQLAAAGPWGQGFPEPLFDGVCTILAIRVVGEKHLKLSLNMAGLAAPLSAIAFSKANLAAALAPRVRIAYRLGIDDWQGAHGLQLIVEHIEPA